MWALPCLGASSSPSFTWAARSVLSGRSRSSDGFGLSSVGSEPSAKTLGFRVSGLGFGEMVEGHGPKISVFGETV